MSGLINKAKEVLSGHKGDNPESTNYGSHKHETSNRADPRIDSDLDNRHGTTSSTLGSHNQGGAFSSGNTGSTGSGLTGQHGTHGSGTTGLTGQHGTHGSGTTGLTGQHGTHGQQGDYTSGTTGTTGLTGQHGTHGQQGDYTSGTTGTTGLTGQHGTHGSGTTGLTGQHGTHGSGITGTSGQHGTHGSAFNPGTTTGRHEIPGQIGETPVHNAITKPGHIDVGSTGLGSSTHGSTNAGPHSSNLANKVDPRVDSDRDNRSDPSSRVGGYGTQDNYGTGQGINPAHSSSHQQHGTTGLGTSGGYGQTAGHGTGTDNFGTFDGRDRNTTSGLGTSGGLGTSSGHGHTSGHGTGTDNFGTFDGRDRNTTSGYGSSNTGTSGVTGTGQHGSTGYHDSHGSSGKTNTSAGPHNNNLLNKLDPRVDSNLDGSKGIGK